MLIWELTLLTLFGLDFVGFVRTDDGGFGHDASVELGPVEGDGSSVLDEGGEVVVPLESHVGLANDLLCLHVVRTLTLLIHTYSPTTLLAQKKKECAECIGGS